MKPNNQPTDLPTPPQGSPSAIDERRSQDRAESQAPLRLTLETDSLQGICENISGVGVLFFSENSLRVSVEIEEDGQRRTRTGRLVRVQRMSLENTGFAVEFDPE